MSWGESRTYLEPNMIWFPHENIFLFYCHLLNPLQKCVRPVQYLAKRGRASEGGNVGKRS